MPYDTLISGVQPPRFFYGTAWKGEHTHPLVLAALNAGFRAFDSANQSKYYNECGVGQALAASFQTGQFQRSDLFLQSKFTFAKGHGENKPYDETAPYSVQVRESFAGTLKNLNTTFIDSYLLHAPFNPVGIASADLAVWREMGALLDAGQIRYLGVSNITAIQLRELCQLVQIKPSFVQNLSLRGARWDAEVRAVCQQHGIHYQGYGLLAAKQDGEPLLPIRRISAKLHRTVPQVLFQFAQQLGMLCLTGTTNLAHMVDTLNVSEFRLDEDDIQQIMRLSN